MTRRLELLKRAADFLKEKEYGEAASIYLDLKTRFPAWQQAHLGYVKTLSNTATPSQCAVAWRELVALFPNLLPAYMGLTSCLQQVDDSEAVRSELIALCAHSDHGWCADFALGKIALKAHRVSDAISHLETVLRSRPSLHEAREYFAAALLISERYDDAERECAKLRMLEPTRAQPYLIGIEAAFRSNKNSLAEVITKLMLRNVKPVDQCLVAAYKIYLRYAAVGAAIRLVAPFHASPKQYKLAKLLPHALSVGGQVQEAVHAYGILSKQFPDQLEPYIQSAQLLSGLEDIRAATSAWQQVLDKLMERSDSPKKISVLKTAQKELLKGADYFLKQNRMDQARAIFHDLKVRFPSLGSAHVGYVKSLPLETSAAVRAASWREVLTLFPGSMVAYWGVAASLRLLDDSAPAIHELLILSAHPKFGWVAERELGLIAWDEHRLDDAIKHFQAVLRFNAGEDKTRLYLTKALLLNNRFMEADRESAELLRKNPTTVNLYLLAITAAICLGDTVRARLICRAMVKNIAQPRDGVTKAFQIYLKYGALDAALEEADIFLRSAMLEVDMACRLPRALYENGRVQDAYNVCTTLSLNFPSSIRVMLEIARIRSGGVDNMAAAAAWYQVLTLVEKKSAGSLSSKILKEIQKGLMKCAEHFYEKNFYREAAEIFDALKTRFPRDPSTHLGYLKTLALTGSPEELTAGWREMLRQFPESRHACRGLISCLNLATDQVAARQELFEMSRYLRHGWYAAYALGVMALAEQRWDDAVAHFSAVLESEPENYTTQISLATALLRSDRYGEVENICSRWLQLDPSKPRPYLFAVEAAIAVGDINRAYMVCEAMLGSCAILPNYLIGLIKIYLKHGELDAAIAVEKLFSSVGVVELKVGVLIARALNDAGRLYEAVNAYAEISAHFPLEVGPVVAMAKLLNYLENWPAAAEAWERVLVLDPQHTHALAERFIVRAQRGEVHEATAEMVAMLRANGNEIYVLKSALNFAIKFGRFRSILELTEKLLEIEGGEKEKINFMFARDHALLELNQPVENINELRRLIAMRERDDPFVKKLDALERAVSVQANSSAPAVSQHRNCGPIDVVYTWVDGDEPAWREKFQFHTGIDIKAHTDTAHNAKRYIVAGELQFSLRTIEKFFPEVRSIYIVTDNQRFDTSVLSSTLQKKIKFIDHQDIIPGDQVVLPTFTSDVIEAFLHKIPGLSEIFLYFNDDVFLGAPLDISAIVDESGRPYMDVVHFAPPADFEHAKRRSLSKDNSQYGRKFACMEIFREKFGYIPGYSDTHQFRVLTKANCAETLELWWDQWRATLFCHQVRQRSSPRFCVLRDWLALHRGSHSVRLVRRTDLWRIFSDFDWEHVAMLFERRPKAFCINVPPDRLDRFEFLSRHYFDDLLPAKQPKAPLPVDEFHLAVTTTCPPERGPNIEAVRPASVC